MKLSVSVVYQIVDNDEAEKLSKSISLCSSFPPFASSDTPQFLPQLQINLILQHFSHGITARCLNNSSTPV